MKTAIRCSVVVATLASIGAAAGGTGRTTVALEAKALRSWNILLPAERFAEVGSGIALAHRASNVQADRFAAVLEGSRLKLDLDGNGEMEALVEGEEGFVTLNGTSLQGNPLAYSVRLVQRKGQPWQYSCGSAMVGAIGETKLQFIDQNLNGSFADFGEDALVVGYDRAASLLSQVVSIDGSLYSIDVAADGSSFSYEPYSGDSGTLDLTSQFESKAKLEAVVVASADGKNSFSLAKAKNGLVVPAGEYKLLSGQVVLGDSKATLKGGRAKSFTVGAKAHQTVAWGGPVKAEFAYKRDGETVAFTPWDIWYYGQLGEEYSNFLPLGTSPEFVIADKATGEVLTTARFPGNCCGFGFRPVVAEFKAKGEITITMKGDNWAFGPYTGTQRWTAYGLTERPVGTEKPATGS